MGSGMSSLIKCRGLPFRASAEQVVQFFGWCEIVGGVEGVNFLTGADGRRSGEAIIYFRDESTAKEALQYDRQTFPGTSRYVECFSCTEAEAGKQKKNKNK